MKIRHIIALALGLMGLHQGQAQISRPLPVLQSNPDVRSAALGNVVAGDSKAMHLYTAPGSIFGSDKRFAIDLSTEIYPKLEHSEGRLMQYNLATAYRLHPAHALFLGFRYQGGLKACYSPAYAYSAVGCDAGAEVVKPFEWSLDLGYAFRLSEAFSLDIAGNLIASWIGKGAYTGGLSIGGHFRKEWSLGSRPLEFNLRAKLSDLIGVITYEGGGMSDYLPSAAHLGSSFALDLSAQHRLSVLLGGRYYFMPREAKLLIMGTGLEYGFKQMLFARLGYECGERELSNLSLGLGLRWKSLQLDLSYRKSMQSDNSLSNLMLGIGYRL